MGMNQTNSWENKKTVIKGDFGEDIINQFLESKGFVIYKPTTKSAHAFDRLAIKDKKQVVIVEVKTKPRRLYYPDTGIDIKHYNTYKEISKKHNIPVYLFFVDEEEGYIYGNYLSNLTEICIVKQRRKEIQYPLIEKNIIYFPLSKMNKLYKLTDKQIKFLKENSTRNINYIYN